MKSLLAALLLLSFYVPISRAELGPDGGQRALIERGYGMFIHFGVNTFIQT